MAAPDDHDAPDAPDEHDAQDDQAPEPFDAYRVAREILGRSLPDDNDAQRIAAKIREMGG